ncbi:hypothetical protein PPN31119_00756 [Pandoraea pnomenusa]|uniref:Uncharacterized protein n=2 Tax=Burkholderiaceae TaxID=119060 RepID=A0A378YDC1_9BURK|nr:Uncharacterised protein [Pandoraea pnomenusa]VVE62148.1 hypothetical protein PPN31119_00756 [Pandoraea pnomenusa]
MRGAAATVASLQWPCADTDPAAPRPGLAMRVDALDIALGRIDAADAAARHKAMHAFLASGRGACDAPWLTHFRTTEHDSQSLAKALHVCHVASQPHGLTFVRDTFGQARVDTWVRDVLSQLRADARDALFLWRPHPGSDADLPRVLSSGVVTLAVPGTPGCRVPLLAPCVRDAGLDLTPDEMAQVLTTPCVRHRMDGRGTVLYALTQTALDDDGKAAAAGLVDLVRAFDGSLPCALHDLESRGLLRELRRLAFNTQSTKESLHAGQ